MISKQENTQNNISVLDSERSHSSTSLTGRNNMSQLNNNTASKLFPPTTAVDKSVTGKPPLGSSM
jgi:hypothetical protein